MPRAVLLSGGHDTLLMATRSEILRQEGYSVVQATTCTDLVAKFFAGDFDLVILCHTIREEERRRTTALIRKHSPSTPVLILAATEAEYWPYADATVSEPISLLG